MISFKKKKFFFYNPNARDESCIRVSHISLVKKDKDNILIILNGEKEITFQFIDEDMALAAYCRIVTGKHEIL